MPQMAEKASPDAPPNCAVVPELVYWNCVPASSPIRQQRQNLLN